MRMYCTNSGLGNSYALVNYHGNQYKNTIFFVMVSLLKWIIFQTTDKFCNWHWSVKGGIVMWSVKMIESINYANQFQTYESEAWSLHSILKVEALWFGCYRVIILHLSGKNESEWFLLFSLSDIFLRYSCVQFSVCILRNLLSRH